jgi:CheY-like chemotaxis protein
VYGIVKQSDGYIWVYSELGRGTTFKLYFPEHEQGSQKVADPTPVFDLVVGTETILVVEDDESLRKLITSLLASAGYQVLEAADGAAAVNVAQNYDAQIDLLLTDVLMPVMSGVELSGKLKRIRPDMKVLMMSGYAGDLIACHRATEPNTMLIGKPFTRIDLFAKIRTALRPQV